MLDWDKEEGGGEEVKKWNVDEGEKAVKRKGKKGVGKVRRNVKREGRNKEGESDGQEERSKGGKMERIKDRPEERNEGSE